MYQKKSILATTFFLMAATLVALAAAPASLSVTINGKALSGKALWYDGKIYVPLKSISQALDGEYSYDPDTGLASVSLSDTSPAATSADFPVLRVTRDRAYSTGDNLKILATVVNKGLVTAKDIELTCTFMGTSRQQLNASVAQIPELKPGQRKTVEFWLYEQRLPDENGGRAYAQPMSVPGAYLGKDSQHVYIGQNWQRVSYQWEFNYRNPDNSYSTKKG